MRLSRLILLILVTAALPTFAESSFDDNAVRGVAEMPGASIDRSPVTGAIRHARFSAAVAIADGDEIHEKAELFMLRHGAAFGADPASAELKLTRERTDRIGHTHLVYQQHHRGLPVYGARMGLHFDASGRLVAANSTLLPVDQDDDIRPNLDAAAARRLGISLVSKQHEVDPRDLDVVEAELLLFHDGAVWGRAGDTHLSWRLRIADGGAVAEELFFDANDGRLLARISGIEHIYRMIYESSGTNLVWQEGDPLPYSGSGAFRDEEINNLITVAEQTYNTFANISGGGFLSYTGNDARMRSYYDRPGDDCPNAYFNGTSTNFCVGTATDDVIAHEWVHGYTRSTHGLVYQWQSGALNEAYSDIFGELVDLLYDSGTDAPSTIRQAETCSSATATEIPELEVLAPADIAGPMTVRSADFNPAPPWTVTGAVELADDGIGLGNDACDELVDFTPGTIALITMGACDERFLTPVSNAEAAGAIAAIVVNPLNDNVTTMSGTGRLDIPSVFLGRSDGDLLRDAVDRGLQVTMRAGGNGSLRWLVAEDSASFGGAIRDMWRPECLGDPGRVFSPDYFCSSGDNGGVHRNSGVPNHAFALLVDGGSFNGFDIPAIGMTRAAHIYWRAMSVYQFPLSDFRDHAVILATSCRDLIGAPLTDLLTGGPSAETITAAHCAAVDAATLATEMHQWPSQCNFDTILDPDAPDQPGAIEVFSESFDRAPDGWRLSNEGVFPEYIPRDWEWTETVPENGDGGAFYAADNPTLGNCGNDDQSGVVHLDSPPIELPVGAFPVLRFDHYVATEERVDGGNLKISVDGGPFELVPADAFLFNPYNDVLRQAQWNDNPLAGEEAFVGTNETTYRGSWGQSQVDLSGFVRGGETIVLRFDFGTDGCAGQDGWYVDNVRITMQPRHRDGYRRVTP